MTSLPTLGVVTIGQTPRVDLTPELTAVLPPCRLVEHGALDGLSTEEIAALAPRPGEHAVTSRLRDGGSAVFGHDQSLGLVAAAIRRAEDDGADLVLLACSGSFVGLEHRKPLLLVEQLAHHAVAGLGPELRIGIVRPLAAQLSDAGEAWARTLGRAVAAVDVAAPYSDGQAASAAAAARIADSTDVIILDCMGFDEPMRRAAAEASGRTVLLVRGLAARVTAEFVAGIGY
ncbi:AroM family protein [Actinoalloteichus hymeniacidonis]|uniref:AroM protein n=1 Tax=Actinoalloteichus hymeniacidonis TaxID=340345 RepID=A0AAC9HRK3_9PSEU|nr:AroM family protein [Actinoalloteichus hymeniacidonis]AOS63941.1 AroM protein [Actinoalloteichus hymeniacidonis]MBB5908002.1 protein AroM [Actinoalloteichus hymeniacidonis]